MTLERLEEIAAWAADEAQVAKRGGLLATEQVFADLARCARAWATVKKSGGDDWHWTMDNCNDPALLSWCNAGVDCPVEAVEAAREGR